MVEISGKEFTNYLRKLHERKPNEIVSKDISEWSDFVDIRLTDKQGKEYLRKTEQENYDEVNVYPSTIRYYVNKDSFTELSNQGTYK